MKEKKVSDNQKVEKQEIKRAAKDERIILFQDTPKIEELKNKLNELMPFAEKIIKAYHLLEFADPQAGFFDLISNTESRAKQYLRKVVTENTTIPGVEIDTTAMINNGTYKPAGMAAYSKALDQFLSAGGMNYHTYFKHVEKAVIIDSIVFSKFEALNTIAAITPEEIELFNKWQNFLTNITEFATFIKKYNLNILPVALGPLIIIQIARLDKENKLIVNKDIFQMLTKKIRNKIN